ncbi:MAG: hypothetical protein IJT50_06540 [Lentisphaeria bacterium]|nr:hypothetical protein [Lentisphaeria bacterium]
MNDDSTVPVPETPRQRKKLLLLIAGGAVLAVLLIAAVLAALLLSPWEDIPKVTPRTEDFVLQGKLIRRFYRELSNRKELPERSVLKLTPAEVNSIFRIAANYQGKDLPYPVRYYRPAFSDKGVFAFTMPLRTWAGTIYLKAAFSIAKGPEGLKITPASLKVGRISLPCSGDGIAAGIIDAEMTEANQNPIYELFDQAVESISFDGKHLVIVYRPRKIPLPTLFFQ